MAIENANPCIPTRSKSMRTQESVLRASDQQAFYDGNRPHQVTPAGALEVAMSTEHQEDGLLLAGWEEEEDSVADINFNDSDAKDYNYRGKQAVQVRGIKSTEAGKPAQSSGRRAYVPKDPRRSTTVQ